MLLYYNYIQYDISGVKNSYVHGSIIEGVFTGWVHHPQEGTFYLDEIHDFHGGSTKGKSPLSGYQGHSVIYHHDDVIMPEGLVDLD